MIESMWLAAAVLWLAYANGANDNFKGVATLYGSGVLSYRAARALCTVATLAGVVASIFLAEALLKAFSGRGLVPDAIAALPAFASAVALAAGVTVMLATWRGLPISTTHALVGALAGAGTVAAGSALNASKLANTFLLPLVLGPVVAFALCALAFALLRRTAFFQPAAQNNTACACVVEPTLALHAPVQAAALVPALTVGTLEQDCANAQQVLVAVKPALALNVLHMASGSAVCFARGLNDAPKIAAILLVAQMASVPGTLLLVAAAMLLGGWLHSQKIARTMGHNITTLEPKNACVANVCTSALVLSASVFGLPLSTTHVSIGAISGLMLGQVSTGKSALKPIVLAWCATLPCAALLAALAYTALQLF